MKKFLIALITAATMVLPAPVFAAEDTERVEVSFKVGDSTLKINGTDTTVETPYIAGAGTTLVPLRVITEAFGAKVEWEGQTQSITLTYPNVNIVLQIGSIVAKVNDHNETLLEAPALSANDVTMVPLRFISETFGADVSYDGETGGITVVKEAVSESQTVSGMTDMEKTGDSYYKWSINTPKEMSMTDRRSDGLRTKFAADDSSEMYIDIYKYTEDDLTPFDEEFAKTKDSFSGYTLIEAEKLTDKSGNKYMHFQAKSKDSMIDHREYYGKDSTVYEITSYIELTDDEDIKNMILATADSFTLGAIDEKTTYDLSTVKKIDGIDMRTVSDDKYKVEFAIPADFEQTSTEENTFTFRSYDYSSAGRINLEIYSKSGDITAKSLAEKDYAHNIDTLNPDLAEFSDMKEKDGVYSYTSTVSGAVSEPDNTMTDIFFEKGEYVYNMSITIDASDNQKLTDIIRSSLKTEELDFSKIGKILRNDNDADVMTTNTVKGYTFELPTTWKALTNSGSTVVYRDSVTGSMIMILIDSGNYTSSSLSSEASEFSKHITSQKGNKIIGKIEYETINNERYAKFVYTDESEDVLLYNTVYMKTASNELIMFTLSEPDIAYHKTGNKTFVNAIESFKKK